MDFISWALYEAHELLGLNAGAVTNGVSHSGGMPTPGEVKPASVLENETGMAEDGAQEAEDEGTAGSWLRRQRSRMTWTWGLGDRWLEEPF